MPEAAHQEHHEDVVVPTPLHHPVASERDVEVIPEPGGEGDVPAAPKLLDGFREIGSAEVLHQVKAHHPSRPDGHVRVAREVAVDLEGEEHGGSD